MLYHSTVEPATLVILKKLIAIPELSSFYLVGGTNLSLRYGHRISVDLDLFSTKDFDTDSLIKILEANFTGLSYKSNTNPVGLFCFIDNVKVDFVRHHNFKMIDEEINLEEIRMFGDKDIIAMKITAILRRAQKKDFFDVAELLKKYSLKQMMAFYQTKYPSQMLAISIPHAITYFEDAEQSENPVSLNGETWESVKNSIKKAVRDYLA